MKQQANGNFQAPAPRAQQQQQGGGGFNFQAAGVSDLNQLYNYDKNDPDAYRTHILQRYLGGEGGLKNLVRSYAGALRPDLARSAIQKYQQRSRQRSGLNQALAGQGEQQRAEEDLIKQEANQALGSGIKSTRENFNRRGLLFSGLREGGEQKVRSGVAAQTAQNLGGVAKDYANLADSRKQALASLELQNAQQMQQMADQAFETTNRNNIARRQAYQQLGQGIGAAAGSYYGSRTTTETPRSEYSNAYRPPGDTRFAQPIRD